MADPCYESETSEVFPSLLKQLECEHARQLSDLRRSKEIEILDLRRQLERLLSKSASTTEPLDTTGVEVELGLSPRFAPCFSLDRQDSMDESVRTISPFTSDDHVWERQATHKSLDTSFTMQTKRSTPSCIQQEEEEAAQAAAMNKCHSNHVLYSYLSVKLKQQYVSSAKRLKSSALSKSSWMKRVSGSADKIVKNRCLQELAGKIVAHPRFETTCISMILLNAFSIAAATEQEALNPNEKLPLFYAVVGYVFSIWFLLELMTRLTAVGPCAFLSSRSSWSWNLFDTCVVTSDIVQVVIEIAVDDSSDSAVAATTLRMARILRVVRVMRIFKLVAFLREFRLMVMCILKSGMVLFYSALLMILVMFLFGIFLTQNMTRHLKDGIGNVTLLRKYFGSLERSLYTLFLTISGGLNWETIAEPLFNVDYLLALAYVCYVFFMVFSVLNIITAVFVESVTVSAHSDQEEVIQARLQEYERSLKSLSEIFVAADTDGSNDLSFAEFDRHLEDHKVVAHFSQMGITVEEARVIFHLLDADGDDVVTLDEFVFGCLKIKGQAKTIDLQMLILETRKTRETQSRCFAEILQEVQDVRDLQERLDLELHNRRLGAVSKKSPMGSTADVPLTMKL